jgi:4-hydroxy-3-polyprenylbenzoate decarboxylase
MFFGPVLPLIVVVALWIAGSRRIALPHSRNGARRGEVSAVRDLRGWIDAVDLIGELRRVEGAGCDWEIGGLNDVYMERVGRPALLFDKIPGHRPGFRVLSNVSTSRRRCALTLGLDPDTPGMELVRACKRLLAEQRLVAPETVASGPICEQVQEGASVDLSRFPAPVWHEGDGGAYLGTGSAVILRDPDSDWVNVGCYRAAVHDEKHLGLMISQGKQGRLLMEAWWRRSRPAPVAISMGHDPLLFFVAAMNAAPGVSELSLWGGIAGEPVRVLPGGTTGLPLPADAELVVEGFVHPEERREEGPFGEWTGYYAGGRKPEPVLRVERVYHRRDPIVLGAVPGKPPSDDTYSSTFMTSAAVWAQLEGAGLPGIRGVWAHECGGSRMFLAVAIRQAYAGHARQVGLAAAHTYAGAYLNKFVVVVDDDIDPSSLDDVVWAMCTRFDARSDQVVIPDSWSSPLDPMAYPPERPLYTTKVVLDACRPWHRRDSFPAVVGLSTERRQRLRECWPELFAGL